MSGGTLSPLMIGLITGVGTGLATGDPLKGIMGAFGGWGGATAAKYIRLQDPSIEVVMIEREPVFRSCPISNWVITGLKTMADITVSYNALKTNHGIKVVHDTVTEIDPGQRMVRISDGMIKYDRLVVSPGITLIND
ncbi:MAG: cytochrome C, partial [Planctomycetota bacterium]